MHHHSKTFFISDDALLISNKLVSTYWHVISAKIALNFTDILRTENGTENEMMRYVKILNCVSSNVFVSFISFKSYVLMQFDLH